MKPPEPVSPSSDRSSRAPYNFVPLPDRVYKPPGPLPRHGEHSEGHLSGQIEISLRTETWLYTRTGIPPSQASDDDLRAFEPNSPYPEFFHHGDPKAPVVPGSSLRGMLRQLIEVLSDGRLDMARKEPIIYRAVGDTTRFGRFYKGRFVGRAVRGGYLFARDRAWFILPAKEHHGASFVRFADERGRKMHPNFPTREQHYPVWVEPRDPRTEKVPKHRSEPCPTGWAAGNLVVTDGLENKHTHPVIYEPDHAAKSLPVPEELKKLYERDRHDVQRDPKHQGRALKPVEWDGKGPLSELPCFYLLDAGKLVFFGATLFFRLPYRRSPRDFIEFQNQDPPDEAKPDLASRMFGTLDAPKGAIKGRVRFEDLMWDPAEGPEDPFVGIRYPKPLLAPKPACIQHYLVQQSDKKEILRHYDDPPHHEAGQQEETTVLRGFKHYWHRKDPDRLEQIVESHLDSSDPDKKRTVIRPVKEGVAFRGRIHFDNLSPEELGALLVALDLEPNLRHKLGMARPFGYGSVRIEREEIRIVDPAERYRTFFAADQSGGGPPALNAGWKKDSEEIAQRAKRSFCLALAKHRKGKLAGDAGAEEVFRAFWSSDRMRDLAALLEWDRRPSWRATEPAGLDNDQWKKRKVLPPPTALVQPERPPTGPSREAASPPRVTIVGQALSETLRKPDESAGRRRAAPATKPLKPGQPRTGKLMKVGGSWVAVLDGVPKNAAIRNEGEIPPGTPEGAAARFEVKVVSDYAGVQVTWKGFVE